MWADEILNLSPRERASTIRYSPFLVIPDSGRLILANESIRRVSGDQTTSFPEQESPGWKQFDENFVAWCALGAEPILAGEMPPRRVIGPFSGTLDLSIERVWALIASGRAFAFLNNLYLLPDAEFAANSFKYELPNHEPLAVFIGYRGHIARYDEIITPSVLRRHRNPSRDSFFSYKRRECIASNVVKEVFWQKQRVALADIQARGILQHHGVIGATDILDLSYDLNVAKWFALNRYEPSDSSYSPKSFVAQDRDPLDAASFVYKVVVRVLGATDEPLPLQLKGQDVVLLPHNLTFLWSLRPEGQRGFGLSGIGLDDYDRFGAVLNITEYRYHPTEFPNGWDEIGGPYLTLNECKFHATDDSSSLESLLFPPEPSWFDEMLTSIRERTLNLV